MDDEVLLLLLSKSFFSRLGALFEALFSDLPTLMTSLILGGGGGVVLFFS